MFAADDNAWASEKGRTIGGEGGCRKHSAYTLLEVILALALTTVILGLIGMAMHIHLGVADKSRGQVEEAQLARTLLQHIAEDLRNSVPYSQANGTLTMGGTSAGSTAATSTTAAASTASGTSTGSDSSDSGNLIPSGISGTAQCLQMDTTRRVRPIGMAMPVNGDPADYMALSDVKTVTYSLGDPGTATPLQRGDSSTGTGLYRREIDRTAYVAAMQQGQSDLLTQGIAKMAPEVANLQFTYYAGSTTYEQWDSNTEGGLPSAIRVAITIQRASPRPATPTAAAGGAASFTVYDMLVDLPNAQGSPALGGSTAGGTTSGAGTTTSPTGGSRNSGGGTGGGGGGKGGTAGGGKGGTAGGGKGGTAGGGKGGTTGGGGTGSGTGGKGGGSGGGKAGGGTSGKGK